MANDRMIGTTPITDAAAANAPDSKVATDAAARVAGEQANVEPAELDNDGGEAAEASEQDDESANLGEADMEEGDLDEHGNAPRNNADPYIP